MDRAMELRVEVEARRRLPHVTMAVEVILVVFCDHKQ